MTDMQYHQDNERQGRYTASAPTAQTTAPGNANPASTLPLRSMYPEQKRFRLVPAAVICAFVAVGCLAYYNYRQTDTKTEIAADASPSIVAVASPVNLTRASNSPTLEEPVAMTAHSDLAPTVNAAGGETVTIPADTKINISTGDQTVSIPASRLSEAAGAGTINININPGSGTTTKGGQTVQAAAPVVRTVQTVQTVPQVVQVPVQTYNYVPQGTYYYNNYNYSTNNKPYTPYIENCGNFDGDHRWNDARIVLPKFEKDGKAAVEYEVNVGTSVGNSDVHSHRYEQTDRVVFSVSIDNEREYFVRYRVRMEGGDFGDWSDTFRFVCHRY